MANGRCDWRRNQVTTLWGEGVGWAGAWQASKMTLSFPTVQNPEQSADEDAEKNEEDSEGEGDTLAASG